MWPSLLNEDLACAAEKIRWSPFLGISTNCAKKTALLQNCAQVAALA